MDSLGLVWDMLLVVGEIVLMVTVILIATECCIH